MLRLTVPIVAALLFRFGGMDQWKWCVIPWTKIEINQKLWRWLMGIVIGLLAWSGWIDFGLTIGAYFLATNLFGYGDKTPILKFLPQNIKHLVSGVIFGLASIPLLGWIGVLQGLISGITFYLIETKKVNNPWAENLRGGMGTILFLMRP